MPEQTTRSRSRRHAARFDYAAVHFVIAMQVDGGLDIAKASRRLLAQDIAISAAWPSEEQIRVAKRFRLQRARLDEARHLHVALDRVFESKTWRSAMRAAVRHPDFGIQAFQTVWAHKMGKDLERTIASGTIRSLVWFVIKHPIFGPLKVLPNVTLSPDKDSDEDEESESGPAPEFEFTERYDPTWGDKALKTLDKAEESMLNEQAVSAIERGHDENLFGGLDRDEDRFVRLMLRASRHRLRVPGTSRTHDVVLEPRLFMHESGIIELTVRVGTDGPLSTDQIVELMWGPEPVVEESRLPEGLIPRYAFDVEPTWEKPTKGGTAFATFSHQEPVSMIRLGLALLSVVEQSIRRQMRFYTNHPIAILQAGDCCSPEKWRTNHADELKHITMRMAMKYPVAEHSSLERDLSSTSDHSLYVNMACSTYVQVKGSAPRGLPELQTVLLIEYAFVLYRRLVALEETLGTLRLGDRRLQRRYREAIRLFSELRQGDVRAGGAREIVRHLLSDLGADHLRGTIESALNLTSMAHATESASKASRRAWWLTLAATIVAVLVSIPSLQSLLRTIKGTSEDGAGEWVIAPLRAFTGDPFWGAWQIVGLLLALLLLAWVISLVIRKRPTKRRSTRRGYAWPMVIDLVEEDSDEPDGSTRPPAAVK